MRAATWSSGAPSSWAAEWSASSRLATSSSAAAPLTASMRRSPVPMLDSPVIRNGADLPGGRHVRAAAQLRAVAVDLHHADSLRRVLLAEEHVGADRLRLGQRHLGRRDRRVAPDLGIHAPLDLPQRLARGGGRRREVEAQPIGPDPAAGLLGLLAQDVAQGAMQQVGGGVVACRAPASLLIDAGRHDVSPAASSPSSSPDVHDRVADALRVVDHERARARRPARRGRRSGRRPRRRTGVRSSTTCADPSPSATSRTRRPIGGGLVRIADELAPQPLDARERRERAGARPARAFALLGHRRVEAGAINASRRSPPRSRRSGRSGSRRCRAAGTPRRR